MLYNNFSFVLKRHERLNMRRTILWLFRIFPYFVLCHPLQHTHCLFTCHTSQYHHNSMLISLYTYPPFYYLLPYLHPSECIWITAWFGLIWYVSLSPRQRQKQFSVWKRSIFCFPIFNKKKFFQGEWYFGCVVFHLHILHGLPLIEVSFMSNLNGAIPF